MIFRIVILLTFSGALHCYPQKFSLNVSPEEVNSLEQEEPLGRSIDPQTPNNLEDTVKEVEKIIKSNPALPRLTRGEILDLLENITVVDKVKESAKRQPKAVMVVMPFTPNNDNNMEELYTKPPVTHIIGAEPFKTKEEVGKERRRPEVRFNGTDNNVKKPVFEEKKKYSASISEKPSKTPSRTPIRRRRPEATTQPAPTTYRPSTRRPVRRRTTQHPNHRYEDTVPVGGIRTEPIGGIRVIQPPKLNPKPHKNDLESELDFQENVQHEVFVKPNFPLTASLTKPLSLTQQIDFPDNLKSVVKDLDLEEAVSPDAEVLTSRLEEQDRIKHMLASIGVLPVSTTTTTTTTAAPNAESVAESLSPEMRDLLMSFGLLPNPNEKPEKNQNGKYYPEKAEVKPESYVGFKPLPDDGPGREDMDALLASFGLGRSARNGKAIKKVDDKQTLSFDMIPDNLKDVISDLGIEEVERESKKLATTEKQHVFNPDTQYATEEELKKLEKLIAMIKQLEKMNGTATEEDLKKIDLESLKELVKSLNTNNETLETLEQQENSPDPTAFDAGLIKNEVKRQENSTTTTATTLSVSESATPSLADLEASFGGQAEAVTEPPVPETTTRKNGFYYLVDWNTFLDIDDTKGKRVNLRFQPTIGDPKRFLSVTVP